jgi:hypothetical protein
VASETIMEHSRKKTHFEIGTMCDYAKQWRGVKEEKKFNAKIIIIFMQNEKK